MKPSTSLSLGIPKSPSPISSNFTSPTDPSSIPSSPRGVPLASGSDSFLHIRSDSRERSQTPALNSQQDLAGSPEFTSLPPFPASPKGPPKNTLEASRTFFSNLKASKSSNKVHTTSEPTIRQVSEEISRSKLDLSDGSIYSRPSPGSTPDLSLSTFDTDSTDRPELGETKTSDYGIPPRPKASQLQSEELIGKSAPESASSRKPKPRFGNLIGRTRSIRMEESGKGPGRNTGRSSGRKLKPHAPIITTNTPQIQLQYDGSDDLHTPNHTPSTPMTAPLPIDRFPRDEGSPGPRNRSAERGRENGNLHSEHRHIPSGLANSSSGLFKDSTGSHLFNNIRNTSSRAAGGLNKAGKGIIAKMNRSGSSNNNKEEERHVCRIINLPLVEQTRRTRIAARLENSKDKTEFWMPALPWRCIDYLNFRGCEEEGLYRVPGSDREIRLWQKRFDQEGDIDLFEEDNLYDINVVGSLFKSWLRELPTEIFPKSVQNKIYQAHPDAIEVPQLLKDELSLLPPWNYYLLFAITCHLSLLTAYSEKNKMTYGNLVICFQPCLRIDNYCFQFLVQKWRDCWQGCWTEKEALEEEYRLLDRTQEAPGSSGGSSGGSITVAGVGEEPRPLAPFSGSHSMPPPAPPNTARSQNRPPPLTLSTGAEGDVSTRSNAHGGQNGHARTGSHLPELAPVQPLSPIGF